MVEIQCLQNGAQGMFTVIFLCTCTTAVLITARRTIRGPAVTPQFLRHGLHVKVVTHNMVHGDLK